MASSMVEAICPDADRAVGWEGTDAARLKSLRLCSGLASPLFTTGAWGPAPVLLSGTAKGVGSCLKALLLASCTLSNSYHEQQ